MKSAQLPGENSSERKGPIARKGAIFFCAAAMTAVVCGLVLSVSCGRTSVATEKEDIAAGPHTATETRPHAVSERGVSHSIEELELELERAQFGNVMLKEENDWLRSEVIRLHQELAEATQTIYSLNTKLDAIFKPNNTAE